MYACGCLSCAWWRPSASVRVAVAFGVAAAVHVSWPKPMLHGGALVATVVLEAYAGLGVGVMDLNR